MLELLLIIGGDLLGGDLFGGVLFCGNLLGDLFFFDILGGFGFFIIVIFMLVSDFL